MSAGSIIIGRPYQGTHSLGNWQSDDAYDLRAPVGTSMTAAASGVVVSVVKHPQDGSRFAGDAITIRTSDGNDLFYKHGVATVSAGQKVKAGDVIGTTGSANGVAHLHFAARIDPRQYLGRVLRGASAPGPNPAGAVVEGGKAVVGGAKAVVDAGQSAVDLTTTVVGFLKDPRKGLLYLLLLAAGGALAVTGLIYLLGSSPSNLAEGAKQKATQAAELALLVAPK